VTIKGYWCGFVGNRVIGFHAEDKAFHDPSR
jgi:hypothetical protein